MIRCGFMPAYFPELGLPHMAHHLSEHSDWTVRGMRVDIMWFGLLRPLFETTREGIKYGRL